MAAALGRFAQFCAAAGIPVPAAETRQHSFERGNRAVIWEFHTEFVTITWRAEPGDDVNWPEDIGIEVLEEALLIGALRIDVIAEDQVPARLLPGSGSIACASPMSKAGWGRSRPISSPTTPVHPLRIRGRRLSPLRRSILVRRLLEIETYRTMALLGLPLARQLSPDLRAAETELTVWWKRCPTPRPPTRRRRRFWR